MALIKGTNSYATVAEADAYFTDRLDVVAWTSATVDQKPQALVTATSILEDMPWVGITISELQPLAFPRVGTYYDPRLGRNVTFDSITPNRIILASYELAHHLLNNDGLLDDTGCASELSISSISLGSIRPTNLIPANVKRLIRPLLVNAGSSNWWRAN